MKSAEKYFNMLEEGMSVTSVALKMRMEFNYPTTSEAIKQAQCLQDIITSGKKDFYLNYNQPKNDKQDLDLPLPVPPPPYFVPPSPLSPPSPLVPSSPLPPMPNKESQLPPMPIMADPIISPDGKFMWTGTEWIPAPPSSSPATNVSLQEDEELENDKLTFIEMEDIDEERIAELEFYLKGDISLSTVAYALRYSLGYNNIHITKEASLEIVKKIDKNLRQKPWGGDGNEVQDGENVP
jgi:hypothetical protein